MAALDAEALSQSLRFKSTIPAAGAGLPRQNLTHEIA
jgi:hypothetical protein